MNAKRCGLGVVVCGMLVGSAWGEAGAPERVMPSGTFAGPSVVAALGDSIYSVESDGGLYRTHPRSGARVRVGAAVFGNTKHLFSSGGRLYTIESDGNLYRVDAGDGTWQSVGSGGAWADVVAAAVVPVDGKGEVLMTVASDGRLCGTSLADGSWKQIGKPVFGNTRFMTTCEGRLFTIEADGSLYQVDPGYGSWRRVGPKGFLQDVVIATSFQGRLYLVSEAGRLFTINPATQTAANLAVEYDETKFLTAAEGTLYAVEADGGLARVDLSHDSFDLMRLDSDRFRAVVEYRNREGIRKTATFDGTAAEILTWLKFLPGLPADARRSMASALAGAASATNQ